MHRWLLLLGWLATPALATVEHVKVSQQEGRYEIVVEALLQAPLPAVHALLADPAGYPALNDRIREARLLGEPAGGVQRVRIVSRPCVLLVCTTLTQVQDFTYTDDRVHAVIVAQGSDFREGVSEWRLRAEGDATRLSFQARLTPAFRVPPLLGHWAARRALRNETLRTLERLELLARQAQP